MADEKVKEDIYALEKPNGLPAYPKMVYRDTGEKHPNGAPKMEELGVVKNPAEHKALLAESKPTWAGSEKK